MFDHLVESRVKQHRSWKEVMVSLAVHSAVTLGAIRATQGIAETIRDQPLETIMPFFPSSKPAEAASPSPSAAPMTDHLPPRGIKTLPILTDVPDEIPPIDLDAKAVNPLDYLEDGVQGGSRDGVVNGVGHDLGGRGSGGAGRGGGPGGAFFPGDLDEQVVPINIPKPRYPPALQSMGIAGRVELQYIVDTTGRVEPHSLTVLSTTHEAFVAPAKEAILKATFKPAKAQGRTVRQLVTQPVVFKMK